jgi:hypothetical protein
MTNFPLQSPHTFRRLPDGRERRLLGWTEEGQAVHAIYDTDDVTTVEHVPTPTGWYRVSWYSDNPGHDPTAMWRLTKLPIIVWRIERTSGLNAAGTEFSYSITKPICPEDWLEDELLYGVLAPDNLVYVYEEDPIPYDDWLKAKQEATVQAAAREKATTAK